MQFFIGLTAAFASFVAAYPATGAIGKIDSALSAIGLSLDNSVTELVSAIGLHQTDEQVTGILASEVQTVDNVLNGLDKVVDGLLNDLHEGDVVTLVNTLETDLGLSPTNTIGDLLRELHLL